ncbi:MAG TPA: thioesterase family protein [Ktedonobacterales bacterium]|jgi:YbgC/YbaW family acyl-CoA thioester hydrolase
MGEMPRETTRIRVAFVDVDSSQRIHYTAMFRWFEVAEHALMRALAIPYATALHDYKFPRVHLDADFRGAIGFDDLLDLEAWVDRVGTSSWTVAFTARKLPDMAVVAEGHMTIVALDHATERPVPLPALLREALTGERA